MDVSRADPVPPKHRERGTQLLIAATSAIAERGYDGVRLRDIAVASGVTTGMLQYYFPSREALLNAAFRHAALDQIAGWRTAVASEPKPGKRLRVLIEHMTEEFSSPATCSMWTELCATASRRADLRPIVSHVFKEWTEILDAVVGDAIADGSISVVMPPKDAINILVAAFDGYELDIASASGATTPETARRQILQLADTLFPRNLRSD